MVYTRLVRRVATVPRGICSFWQRTEDAADFIMLNAARDVVLVLVLVIVSCRVVVAVEFVDRSFSRVHCYVSVLISLPDKIAV